SAERYSQLALKADPNDQVAWVTQAQLAAQKSDWPQTGARLNTVAQHNPRLLSEAVGWWPPKLQPQPPSTISGSAAKFLACVREGKTPCDFGPLPNLSSSSSSALYREQRWEQLTKLPVPQPIQPEVWFRRGVAFAKLEDCQQAIPALER